MTATPSHDNSDDEKWLDILRGTHPPAPYSNDEQLADLLRQAVRENEPHIEGKTFSVAELERRVVTAARREKLAPDVSDTAKKGPLGHLSSLATHLSQLFSTRAFAMSMGLVLVFGVVTLMSTQLLEMPDEEIVGFRGGPVVLPPLDSSTPEKTATTLVAALSKAGIEASAIEHDGAWRISIFVNKGQEKTASAIVRDTNHLIKDGGHYQFVVRPRE